jgi:NAD(P)-dependent dehydrogenase (short-subunit alcohol dehydrogenase family)
MLQDKVVVVSGVGPGLGRAIAVRSALNGADVVLAARTESRLAEVAREVEATGRRALAVPTDITDDESIEVLAKTVRETFGRVDVLVNNAMVPPAVGELADIDLDDIRACVETNTYAALRMTRAFKPGLVAHKGSVVMINSGVIRHAKGPLGAYRLAKVALLSMAQSLSNDLGPQGVRVNTVTPNYVWGEPLKGAFTFLAEQRGISLQEIYDEMAAPSDLRRLPEPDEVADAVIFLASDMARAITGQSLDVNGGEYHN